MVRLICLPWPQVKPLAFLNRSRFRFRRLFPAAFAAIAFLVLLGGTLHAPNNFDALVYRLPRLLHWLMSDGWEWIPTNKNNLNTRSTGFEWWMAPLLAILRSDRALFLLNWISFLFMPGLVFNVFRQMGVSNGVSAVWMWIFPAGYCYSLQAGGIGNDMVVAVFALAAFDYGFRWKASAAPIAMWLSLVCCALMTAMKPTTLPLLLPYGVLFFAMWRPLIGQPFRTITLAGLLVWTSFLPTSVINHRKCGDWTGAAAEDQKLGQVEPLIGISTNMINATIQNLAPPVLPVAGAWNKMIDDVIPASVLERTRRSFEPAGARFALNDFQNEESLGIGTGLSLLVILSLVCAWVCRGKHRQAIANYGSRYECALLCGLFGAALLAYFSKAGMSTVARHIAPFYPFFFAVALRSPLQKSVLKLRLWKWTASLAMGSTIFLLVITPSRPLWPARWFFSKGVESDSRIFQRAKNGYDVYANRADGLGPLRHAIPADTRDVAYLSYSTSAELPLWKPYMLRKLYHVVASDTINSLRGRGIKYLVLNTGGFEKQRGVTPERWIDHEGAKLIFRTKLQLLASELPSEWWVVSLFPERTPDHTAR
ncbi:MAG: hypothetical protein ACKO2G_08240 [Verrucomicrobiales bacterium]